MARIDTEHRFMAETGKQRCDEFMDRAIGLAADSAAGDGGPFGAVIVRDGAVLAEGANTVTRDHDPTAHAEINAIRSACSVLGTFHLAGCEVYSSCEPCPMCLGAIYWAGISRVYYSATREDAFRAGFDDERICRELSLPVTEHSIGMVHVLSSGSLEPFGRWLFDASRTPY